MGKLKVDDDLAKRLYIFKTKTANWFITILSKFEICVFLYASLVCDLYDVYASPLHRV